MKLKKRLVALFGKPIRFLLRDKIFTQPGHGEYMRIIKRFNVVLGDNPLVVEVGSLDGMDSIQLSRHFDCNVHCFEPNPIQIPTVRANIASGGFQDRITLWPFAVNSKSGNFDFIYSGENNPGASSLYNFSQDTSALDHTLAHEQTMLRVECIRLDEWMSDNRIARIDLLCMDCQGAELDVLKGLGKRLANVQFVILEGQLVPLYDKAPTIWEIDAYLRSNGFKLVSNNLRKIPGIRFNNFLYQRI
jgi:FkbM family methyltransferase